MTRIYIAGPCTGIKDLNYPAFHAAAASLRTLGYDVVSPAEINAGADAAMARVPKEDAAAWRLHWRLCMNADIVQLVTCDAVALLPGWEHSKGARVEEQLALGLGLRVAPIECFLAGDDSVVPPITFSAASTTTPYKTPQWDVREGGDAHKQHRSRGF